MTGERLENTLRSLRAAGAAGPEPRVGPPGKAVRPTGRTWSIRWGSATRCAIGEVRKAPKPNERGYRRELWIAARLLGALGPRG